MTKLLPPIPPGETLLEEFLRPARMSQNELARAIGVAPGRINDIVRGRRGITPDTVRAVFDFYDSHKKARVPHLA